MSKYLLRNLDSLKERLDGEKLSLFLDYDGTLAPIAARPEDASLPLDVKGLLRSLSSIYPLAIITGRGIEDIRKRVPLKGVVFAANHGMEVWGDDFTLLYDAGAAKNSELKKVRISTDAIARSYRGVILEDKKRTLSLHYRLLDARSSKGFLGRIREQTREAVSRGFLRITEGKKVIEIRPRVEWDKGKVVAWLLDRVPFRSTFPIYMGDDETDKDAFREVRGVGCSIFVGGSGGGGADYYLRSQGEVKKFLRWLKEL